MIFFLAAGCGTSVETVGTSAPGSPLTGASGSGSSSAPKVLTALAIAPGSMSLVSGATAQYGATASYSDGTSALLSSGVAWSSSDTGAATINASGWLETDGPGTVTILATSGQIHATAQLQITASPAAVAATFGTSVAPVPGDDLAGPCAYDLLLLDLTEPVRGVWVIFERADSADLWQDPELRALAGRLRLGLVYAHQCNALSYNDLQSDGRKGLAGALRSALSQFASLSGHAEVATANLAMFGFSAAGVLSITTAESMPDRVLAVVTYAAGSAPLQLRQLSPSVNFRQVPLLMLANGDDTMAGTSMIQHYFESGRLPGAPWAFAVQPGVGHCCTMSAKPILLAWMTAVVPLRQSSARAPAPIDLTLGSRGEYTCTADGVLDGSGHTDCQISAAKVVSDPLTSSGPVDAWLPDGSFASAWLAWIKPSAP